MRQACGVATSLFLSVGMLLSFIFGYFIQPWRMVSGVIGIIPLTSMLLQLSILRPGVSARHAKPDLPPREGLLQPHDRRCVEMV